MSELEDLCRALDEVVRPLPALAGTIQHRAARLRSLAAEVQRAAGRVPNGTDCGRVVRALFEAAESTEATAYALGAAVQQGRAFVDRAVGGGGSGANGTGASTAAAGAGASTAAAGAAAMWVPLGAPPGFAMVPLSMIDDSDSNVHGPEAFGKGYSPEDLASAFSALHEVVLPAMANGQGKDYFAELDQRHGLMGTRSYSDTYSGFFGVDHAIRLDQTGGGFHVANGYHRIWVARHAGLSDVPAYVGGHVS